MPRARALWAFCSADSGVPWNCDMVLERVYDGCAVVKLPELEAILAASVLPGGRLLSRRKAAAQLRLTMCSPLRLAILTASPFLWHRRPRT